MVKADPRVIYAKNDTADLKHKNAIRDMVDSAEAKIRQAEAAAEETRRKQIQDAEREMLTRPATVVRGTTAKRFGETGIPVWHYMVGGADIPREFKNLTRGDLGKFAELPLGGGLKARDTVLHQVSGQMADLVHQHPEWVERHRRALEDIKQNYGRLLKSLRDDKAMYALFKSAGLVTIDKGNTRQVQGQYGVYDQPFEVHSMPTLEEVLIRPSGLELVYAIRPGDAAEKWAKQTDVLRPLFAEFGVNTSKLTVVPDDRMRPVLRFRDRDPFADAVIESGPYDAEKGRSLLGVSDHGEQVWITWAGSSGMVVGGVPGSGKTASMLPIFAGMKGQAELYVFDGKAGYDLDPLKAIARVYDNSGNLDAPLETLRQVEAMRTLRAQALHKSLGANNFWNVPLKERQRIGMYPVFVVLDEVQTWLDTSGMDKEEKAVSAEIAKLVRTLIQKARSAGIICVLTTQKPDSQSIPTVIRDNAALKVAFRVSTPEQAITILGKQPSDAPSPQDVPMAAKGRGVMETEGYGLTLFQAGYTSPDELTAQLSEWEPVEDQMTVAQRLLGHKVATPKAEPRRPMFEEPVREEVSPTTAGDVTPSAPQAGTRNADTESVTTPQANPEPFGCPRVEDIRASDAYTDAMILAAYEEGVRRGLIRDVLAPQQPQQPKAAPPPPTPPTPNRDTDVPRTTPRRAPTPKPTLPDDDD